MIPLSNLQGGLGSQDGFPDGASLELSVSVSEEAVYVDAWVWPTAAGEGGGEQFVPLLWTSLLPVEVCDEPVGEGEIVEPGDPPMR